MEIKFLGTGDAFCSGGRNQTCFMVNIAEYQFLLDCGATSLKALKELQVSTAEIEAIVISHFHGDHFGGLPYFLLDANFIAKRTKPLSILGPLGIKERVESLVQITYPGVDPEEFSFPLIFKEYSQMAVDLGPLSIEAIPVIHAVDSLPHGVRIHGAGKILAFSGDSGWTDNLYQIAQGADLFICECNYYYTDLPTHLNYEKIYQEQENFQAKKIILNHFGPEMISRLNSCELLCAQDGLTLTL